MSLQTERRLPDPNEPLTDWEKALLEKFFADPSQLPAKFKTWVADYVSTNGSFNVSSLPTLKGEEWREVGATGQPAFANSWVNYDASTYGACAFYKEASGIVRIKGLVKSGTVPGAIFTLPAGYFPSGNDLYAVIAGGALGRLDIQTDGQVVASTGANSYFSLNVSFRAA